MRVLGDSHKMFHASGVKSRDRRGVHKRWPTADKLPVDRSAGRREKDGQRGRRVWHGVRMEEGGGGDGSFAVNEKLT